MLLTDEKLDEMIREYYLQQFSERDTDRWFDPPAVNVRMFARDGELIVLQAQPITGQITVHIKPL